MKEKNILKAFEERCSNDGIELVADHGHTVRYVDEAEQEQAFVPDFFCPDNNIIYEVCGEHESEDLHRRKSVKIWCQLRGFGYSVVERRYDGDFYIIANLPPPEVL